MDETPQRGDNKIHMNIALYLYRILYIKTRYMISKNIMDIRFSWFNMYK